MVSAALLTPSFSVYAQQPSTLVTGPSIQISTAAIVKSLDAQARNVP